jgi:methyl-accepting chemotaxis protein
MKSLKARLTLFVSVLLVLSVLATITLAFFHMRTLARANLESEAAAIRDAQAARIGEWLEDRRRVVASGRGVLAEPAVQPALMRVLEAGGFSAVFIGFPDKRMVTADPKQYLPPGFDPTVRPWYKLAMERNALVMTPPFMSKSDNKLVVSIAQPVARADTVAGVMAGNVILEDIVREITSIKLAGDSHAFLVDGGGMVIAHRDPDAVLKPIADVLPGLSVERLAAVARGSGLVEQRSGERTDLLTIGEIPGTDWRFGLVIDREAAFAPLRAMVRNVLLLVPVLLVIALVLLNLGVARMLRGLGRLRTALAGMAEGAGDLTVRLKVDAADEVGESATAFNRFVERLQGMFGEVGTEVRAVDTQVALVAGRTSQVATDFSRQADAISHTVRTLDEVDAGIGRIAASVREAEAAVRGADDESTTSASAVERVTEEIGRIAGTMDALSKVVGDLSQRSDEIAGIVDAIRDIADRTNLLALNAAIEAARAGEQGRGFAVVADEVRKLAERTTESTAEIGGMITAIRAEIATAVGSMGTARALVGSGVELGRQATGSIRSIRAQVREIATRMRDIATATGGQAEATSSLAAQAEAVDATIKGSSSALQEADAALRDATARTRQLGAIVDRFKL